MEEKQENRLAKKRVQTKKSAGDGNSGVEECEEKQV